MQNRIHTDQWIQVPLLLAVWFPMAGERPSNDWRHHRRQASTPGRPNRQGRPATSSNAFRLRVLLLLAVLAVGAIVGLLFWQKADPKPLFVGISITDYEEVRGWPINGFAGPDAEALRNRFPDDSVQTLQSQESENILSEIRRLGERTNKSSRSAVLYLSTFGVSVDNTVSLIPAKADPRDANSWLPLTQVIEAARTIKGPLLFLLEVHPVEDLRHGFLADDCRVQLHEQLLRMTKEGSIPFDLFVSSSPAEPPYCSPELKRGIFAFALEEGLRGFADRSNASNQADREVNSSELIAYTQARVRQWDELHKATHFPPKRYGTPQEIRLVSLANPPESVLEPTPLETPEWLSKAWTDLDRWTGINAHRYSPRAFQEYRDTILRAEQRWLGGVPSSLIEADIAPKILDAQRRLKADAPASPPVWSLAQARQTTDAKLLAEVEKALLPFVRKFRQLPAAKSEELDAIIKPLTEKEVSQDWLNAAAIHLFQVLITQPAPNADYSATHLRDAYAALASFKVPADQAKPLPTEWAFVKFLGEADPEIRSLWDAGTLPIILRATIAMEEAIVVDPRSAGKIEPLRRTADTDFQTHFVTMFKTGQKNRESALGELKTLADRYRQIRLLADADAFARREWDETSASLRGYLDTPVLSTVVQNEAERVWVDLLASFRDVGLKIQRSTDAGELNRTAGLLRDHRRHYASLLVPPPSVPLRELRTALRAPIWDARTRLKLETDARTLANQLAPTGVKLMSDSAISNEVAGQDLAKSRLDLGLFKRWQEALSAVGLPQTKSISEIEWAGKIRDANQQLREKAAKSPEGERINLIWLLPPRDWPGETDATVTLRREAERRWASGLAKDRYSALAGKLEELSHPPAKEFAGALRRIASTATLP